MQILIDHPSTPSVPGLCGSCQNCRAYQTESGDLFVRCGNGALGRITKAIAQCTDYDSKQNDWRGTPAHFLAQCWVRAEIYHESTGNYLHIWLSPGQQRELELFNPGKHMDNWILNILRERGLTLADAIEPSDRAPQPATSGY